MITIQCHNCNAVYVYSSGYWNDTPWIRCKRCGNDLKQEALEGLSNNIEME